MNKRNRVVASLLVGAMCFSSVPAYAGVFSSGPAEPVFSAGPDDKPYKPDSTTTTKPTPTPTPKPKREYDVSLKSVGPKVPLEVRKAFINLGYKLNIDPFVSYSGYYNTKDRYITIRQRSDTIYHEVGHFVAFVSGNTDQSDAFVKIYKAEKGKMKYNGYATSSSKEYFAESYKEYLLNPSKLKSERPKTYNAVKAAEAKVTPERVEKILKVYAPVWGL